MPKHIPRTFIDELLTRTDIVALIEQYIQLKKAGANYQALCPFHQEKSPSFTVSHSKQFYHCFGCRAHGNAISFLMDYEHMDFVEAIEELAEQAGLDVPYEETNDASRNSVKSYSSLCDLLDEIKIFYEEELKKSPKAIEYLKSRGLTGQVTKQAGIGFAPDSWDAVLKKFGTSPEQIQQLFDAGMLIQKAPKQYYDRFRNRIMFPIHDRRGRVIGFGGRVMDDSTPKYLNSPETPIFHKGNELYGLYETRKLCRDLERVMVVEGYMDVIGLRQYGINYAVATLGTATTPRHLEQLFRLTPQVVFCFDGDNAGQQAAWRALETLIPLMQDHWQPRFLFLPTKEDPDSLIRQEGQVAFEKRLTQAETISSLLLKKLVEQVDLSTLDGQARLSSLVMPYIKKVQAPFLKQLLINELSKITRIPVEKLSATLPAPEPIKPSLKTVLPKNKISPIRTVMTLLIQYPHLAKCIDISIPQFDAPGLPLLHELLSQIQQQPHITTGQLIELWRGTTAEEQLAVLATEKILLPEEALEKEFFDACKTITAQANQQQIQQLMAKAAAKTINDSERQQLQQLLKEK